MQLKRLIRRYKVLFYITVYTDVSRLYIGIMCRFLH